jgi:hypothetical protein
MTLGGNDLNLVRLSSFSALLVIAGLAVCWPAYSIAGNCVQWDVSGAWQINQTSGVPVRFEIQQSASAPGQKAALSGKAEFSIEGSGNTCSGKLSDQYEAFPPIFGCLLNTPFGVIERGEMTGSIKGNEVALNVNWHRFPTDESKYQGTIDSNGNFSGNARWTNGVNVTTDTWSAGRPVKCITVAGPIRPLGKRPGTTSTGVPPGFVEASQNFDILGLHNRPGSDFNNFEITGTFGEQIAGCAKGCLNDRRCKAWAYVRPGFFGQAMDKGRCFLKENVPAVIKDQCCFAGVKTVDVILDSDVFDAPNGNGQKINGVMLAAHTPGVNLVENLDPWFHVKWPAAPPAGDGWVFSGPSYLALILP